MAQDVIQVLFQAKSDFSAISGDINKLHSQFKNLVLPKGITDNLEKGFNKLTPLMKEYQKQLDKGFKTNKDIQNFNSLKAKISEVFNEIKSDINSVNSKEIQVKADVKHIADLEKRLTGLKEKLNIKTRDIFPDSKPLEDITSKLKNFQSIADNMVTKGGFKTPAIAQMVKEISGSLNKQDFTKYISGIKNLESHLKGLSEDTRLRFAHKLGLDETVTDITKADRAIENFFKSIQLSSSKANGIDNLRVEIGLLEQEIEQVKFDSVTNKTKELGAANASIEQLISGFSQLHAPVEQAASGMVRMVDEVNELKTSTQYFFSLRNMINLLKRGIDDAVQSVKELDAAMTETAVVTDYKVSDLWGMLPQYTQLANQLGATTQGAYETMTLYFQQGLDQQQAFEIGAETMKMARIAGLDYAETTDMMTAALRGFNMELNETSAKRINDVYSELAAITASDTEELGTAMQRTASIAHSAGMSFEGTTAFLAQAIETTREPAENIGTAMKTIVARFQEMKKNPLEISEVDGEEVDYNKVDAALKSIGVSLTDTNGQFRELDQVFLDISSRWDGLTQTQQRYIATVAAGSRQQSRFIAMMDNYDRTVQLFEAANNSAGASDEQFGKTMDSLESKLNKLHNAWQQFTMGIANNSMIKLAVDGMTGLLTVTNKLIDAFSLGFGPLKSFLSIFTAFTGLKMAGRAANSLIGGLGGLVDPQSTVKEGLRSGLFGQGRTNAQAQAISNPIVQAIHQLQQALTGKITVNQNNDSASFETFKEANNNLRAFLQGEGKNSFTIADAYNKINKLDNRQQAAILGQLPGLTLSLKKNGIQFDTQGIKKESAELIQSFNKEINQGLKNNTISTQSAMQIFGTPESFKQAMKARGPEYAKAASEVFFNQDYYQQQYEKYWKDLNVDENFLGHLGSEEALEARTAELQEQAKHKATIDAENKALEEFSQRAKVTQTSGAQIANSFGNIGNYAMVAGQGVAQLGMQLSNAGFESAGAAITNLGYQISSLGQIASSVGSLVGKISGAGGIGALIAAHPVIAGLTATVLALGGAFALVQHNIQKTKKAGEEIVKNFTETNKETTDNIAKLKSYQGELASLSQGVDVNGNNINLDDSQYQRYLEIVDDIAAINPDIVQGYNAQGHAIIDNNQALEDTLQLQQEIQKQAYKTYLSTNSLQTLINARNVNTDYRKATKNFGSSKAEDSGKLNPNNAPLAKDVRNLAKDLRFNAGFDASILKKYGIDSLDALMSGEEEAVRKFVKNQDKIQQELTNAGVEMGEDVLKGFQTLGEDTQAFDEAIKPVYDNLLASISNSSMYKDLAPEMQSALAEGLKDIAGQNLDANEMESAAKALTLRFQDAFDKAEEPLSRADDALEKFTQDLDEAAYKETAGDIAEELRDLAKEAEAVGQVEIAEWYENQASRIENALTDTTYSIAEGIDTLSDNIAKAKASFDSLAEGIDDYYTLSDKAKGLVDTALEDKNTGGNGSKTFWRTYQGLASEEAFNRHDKDEAVANMKQFQKYFAEGSEGATAFVQKLIDSQTDSFKFTEATGKETTKQVKDFFELAEDGTLQIGKDFKNLSDEQYSQLATAFDLSDDGFTAILNNLRQWGDLDFADPELIRKALAVDDRSILTDKKVSVEGQKDKVSRLYYGQSVLDAEMADKSEEERKNRVRDLEVQGSIRLPSGAEELIKAPSKIDNKDEGGLLKQFVNDTKGTGNQMQNVMAALIKSGEYTKEDLSKVHQAILDQNLLAGATDIDKSFDDIYSNAELEVTDPATETANEHLSTISATVSTIAGIVAAGKINEGYLPDAAKQSGNLYNDLVGQKGKADTWAQLFSKGIDIEGNGVITADKFTEYSNRLQSYAQKNDEYITALKEGRNATTDPTKIEEYDAEIKAAETNAKIIAQLLNDAGIHFAQTQTDFSNAVNSVSGKLIEIGGNPNLTQTEQKTLTAGALTDFAKKLESLNFSPEQIQSAFKDNFGIELELKNGEFATEIGSQIQEQLNNLGETEINAILNISSISMPAAAKGKNNTPSAIRRVGTMARGSKKHGYTIDGEPTLTGELGPELVWEPKQNSAYMVGENGPQFANLSKNAVVWNAEQTKKIKKNSRSIGTFGTGAKGIHSFGTMAGGNAAGGAGGTTIPGIFNINANVTVQEVVPPTEVPSIPVKADLQVEGESSGGFLKRIFGGGKGGPSINVAANVTSITTAEQVKAIKITGSVTKLEAAASLNSVDATATVTRVIKGGQVSGEPISVKAIATTTKVKNEVKTPAKSEKATVNTQTMKVTADTSAAQSKINQLIRLFNKTYTLRYKASGPSSISVPISANFTGSWKKTVEITKAAKGQNNYISHHTTPVFGSAAKGPYGTVGPKNKGGLTLTGEEGFEIAWLPNENRSMVLGANGPQMLNLPSDAVIYTHEQSKKILKQKAIPAGSHRNPGTTATGSNLAKYLKVNTTSGGKGGSNGKDKNKNSKKTSTEKALEKVLEKGGKVSVWWENIARIAEVTQRKADKNQKTFEKALKTFGKSASSVSQIGETYKKSLQALQAVYKKEKARADKELKNLDKNGKASISYEVTKVNKKGKKKKETKKETVDIGKYIKYDKTLGTYVIDQKAISAVASKNKSKAKAIKDAAEQKLNDKLSKRNTAEDKIRDAQEALDKIADDIYTTFYQWENSLNKIYLLSQRLSDLNNQMTYQSSREELLSAKALAGFNNEGDGAELRTILEEEKDLMIQQVDTNRQNVNATKEAYENSLKLSTYTARYKNQPNSAEAKADLKAAQWALKFIKAGGTFNENTVASLEAKGFSQDTIERIKKILEDINSKREAAINASNDTLGAVTAMYNKMEEYQSYIADFENELVSGLEEQAEQQINKLDKLNSSLSKALKDLLDQVKKGLDDRRKAEDNAKTESEISQKRQRLAMLQADTSGGHAVEIAQLQKEINDSQRDYQRSLEDQLIEKLQDQGDKAERQRQLQIDLLTANKDIAKQTGTNLAQVKEWLEHPTENYDKIRGAWLANKGYEDMTVNEQKQTEQEFDEAWMKYTGYSDELQKLETTNGHLTSIYEEVKGIAEAIINNNAPGNTSWKGLRDAKISASQARGLGATASQLLEAGYDKGEVFKAGYSKKELSDAKITLKNLMGYKNITDTDLRKRGYDMASVMAARGYKKNVTSYKKMAKAGYKAADFKKAKVSAADALKAGLKKEDVAKAYGLSAMTSTNAISGKDVQSATGAAAGTIQKFVSKNIKDREISQSDMAGVTAKMDINGSKKGGTQTGVIGTSGKKIASNKGSTLYVQGWDTKKGKASGKATSYPITKLTVGLMKQYPKEAKEALIYAIQHQKPGTAINKDIKGLIKQAGISGKTYKLSNGIIGSVGSNGKIYYNSGKKGVQIWNAASGKLALDKYNKNDFIKKAKKKASYSREYDQVLKANGVKKYATGGLATQTGPAWLDGTPSKPELVLNAQDTKNFIALKDVLSHAVGTTNQVENSYGGNATYEININVDHLNNDYDVDKVVERVKKKIVQDSGYRNVTQVRKFR